MIQSGAGAVQTVRFAIIGSGFGGLGMAIRLKQAGVDDFVILEKAGELGGTWRDNTYPDAACDVPSHLYSFSFEPKHDWSHVFARQAEILDYLRHCASKYRLLPHIRFNNDVRAARFDEAAELWEIETAAGERLRAQILVSACGQLNRPIFPDTPGLATFQGRAFHSARWDHSHDLAGRRVAVIGTGASAVQFVPAIADRVARLTVFQRSPAYILPRPDRAYSTRTKTLFRRLPWAARLYRAGIYLQYEWRALAFTRFKGAMTLAVGTPFRRLLARQVPDPALRAKLVPDYPIGCKRILLSSDYLAALAKPSVELVTDPIARVTENGVETVDGRRFPADTLIFGTGFAATEFLAPMRITGRGGRDLNQAWRDGAEAYLGLSVPGFPNFFMLYGPNTNLGHNSIVYMLESQVAHVMRCWRTMQACGATSVEVDADRFRAQTRRVQQRLAHTVWSGCRSWYVDARGRNSANWPGFTPTYRWLARYGTVRAYRFARREPSASDLLTVVSVPEPRDWLERLQAGMLRGALRASFRALIGPPFGPGWQRRVAAALSLSTPGRRDVRRHRMDRDGLPIEIVTPRDGHRDGVILYLHGGAFCLGSPASHRAVTSHLAVEAEMPVWVPDYRLAPEHPYPAALNDALACYRTLRAQGYAADEIVVAGDSAGGALALALALSLRARGEPVPAGLLLLSPVTDGRLSGASLDSHRRRDPMIRRGWVEQSLRWYACPPDEPSHAPLRQSLHGLPPMLIQVGEDEVLLSDSIRLAEHAARCGVPCQLEVHAGRWHVFQLQAFQLRSAVRALATLGRFARARVEAASPAAGRLAS